MNEASKHFFISLFSWSSPLVPLGSVHISQLFIFYICVKISFSFSLLLSESATLFPLSLPVNTSRLLLWYGPRTNKRKLVYALYIVCASLLLSAMVLHWWRWEQAPPSFSLDFSLSPDTASIMLHSARLTSFILFSHHQQKKWSFFPFFATAYISRYLLLQKKLRSLFRNRCGITSHITIIFVHFLSLFHYNYKARGLITLVEQTFTFLSLFIGLVSSRPVTKRKGKGTT